MSDLSEALDDHTQAVQESFGEPMTYCPAASSPIVFRGVWNDAEAAMPQGVTATVWAIDSSLPAPPRKGDVVMRGASRYRVVDSQTGPACQRDGNGGITIFLRQVSHAPDA